MMMRHKLTLPEPVSPEEQAWLDNINHLMQPVFEDAERAGIELMVCGTTVSWPQVKQQKGD